MNVTAQLMKSDLFICVSGNKILNKMGLSLLETIIGGGLYEAPVPSQAMKDNCHFRHRLRCFAGHVIQGQELIMHGEDHLKKLGRECVSFLKMEAHDSYSYTQVLSILTDVLKAGMPQVGSELLIFYY